MTSLTLVLHQHQGLHSVPYSLAQRNLYIEGIYLLKHISTNTIYPKDIPQTLPVISVICHFQIFERRKQLPILLQMHLNYNFQCKNLIHTSLPTHKSFLFIAYTSLSSLFSHSKPFHIPFLAYQVNLFYNYWSHYYSLSLFTMVL